MKKLMLLTLLLVSGFGLQAGRGCREGGYCWDEEYSKASFDQCVANGGEVYEVSCNEAAAAAELAKATAAAAKANIPAETQQALVNAVMNTDITTLKSIIEADPTVINKLLYSYNYTATLLHYAFMSFMNLQSMPIFMFGSEGKNNELLNNTKEAITYLISKGADLNIPDSNGTTVQDQINTLSADLSAALPSELLSAKTAAEATFETPPGFGPLS